jgi:hypothetical protein
MPVEPLSPQTRADQVRAFQSELELLEQEGALTLDAAQRERLAGYHDTLLRGLAAEGDADTSSSLRQLSLGLRLATLLGTVALSTAVVLFVRQVWGGLPTAAQLGLALGAPLVPLLLAEVAAARERSGYIAALFAVVAAAGFGIDLVVVHDVLNLPLSPHPALAWGGLALLLAYRFDILVLLLGGLSASAWWVAASLYALLGGWYPDFLRLPETLILPAVVVLLLPGAIRHGAHRRFSEAYRSLAVVALGLLASMLSVSGEQSLLPFGIRGAEAAYTLGGFTLGIGAMIIGVRRGWPATMRAGAVVSLLLMIVKAVDWWWDLLPAWLFFLVLGLLSLLSILGLRRLRQVAVATP